MTRTVTDFTPDPAGSTGPSEPETPAGRLWARVVWLASWALPPILMGLAYTILALTSDTDRSGKSWMAIGFGFVLILWFVFRIAVESAGLSRALAVGDADRLIAIANKQLRRRRSDASCAPFLVYKALAHELRNEPAEALASATEAKPVGDVHALLAIAIRVISLAQLNRDADARALASDLEVHAKRVDRRLQPMPHHYVHLARAWLHALGGNRTEANAELTKIIDDIRTGISLRERARALRDDAPVREMRGIPHPLPQAFARSRTT